MSIMVLFGPYAYRRPLAAPSSPMHPWADSGLDPDQGPLRSRRIRCQSRLKTFYALLSSRSSPVTPEEKAAGKALSRLQRHGAQTLWLAMAAPLLGGAL